MVLGVIPGHLFLDELEAGSLGSDVSRLLHGNWRCRAWDLLSHHWRYRLGRCLYLENISVRERVPLSRASTFGIGVFDGVLRTKASSRFVQPPTKYMPCFFL